MTKPKNSKIHYPIPPIQKSAAEPPDAAAPPADGANDNAPSAGAGPSKNLTPEARAARVWSAPSASVASRRPAKKSRGSFRGSIVNPRTNREIVFESTLERDLAYILPNLPTVVGIRDQVGPVEYVDEDGVVHNHTFDFVADHEGGTSTAIAVKPAHRVGPSGLEKTMELIGNQQPGFADRFVVRTGDHITRDRAANARLLHRALRGWNEADIADVMAVVSTLRGTVAIRAVVATSRTFGHGFMAVACLIAHGVLEHVGPGPISIESRVRLRRKTATNR
uniref:TnsA endonuclease N-terminal domain-containing protein n=1 Tax=Bosea sp. NBC_00436 TaxID=2969620 RepID=A0A9E7ZXC6_9HYPH